MFQTPEKHEGTTRKASEHLAPHLWDAEQAASDAKRMPDWLVDLYQGGNIAAAGNQPFVGKFIETVVSPAERAGVITGHDGLSEQGRRRIENALLFKAYENACLQGVIEPRAPPVRRLISKRQLLGLIPISFPSVWARMRKGEFPLSVQLDDAGSKSFWYLNEVQQWIESRPRSKLKPLPGSMRPTISSEK